MANQCEVGDLREDKADKTTTEVVETETTGDVEKSTSKVEQ